MQLTLTNNQLHTFAVILDKVKPQSMAVNRGRAKLIAKVQDKLAEYINDEAAILKDYCEIDEFGQFVQDESGSLKLTDPTQANAIRELQSELAKEKVILDSGEYRQRYQDFLDWLARAEDDFSGEEIVLIDDLLEQYEIQKQGETL